MSRASSGGDEGEFEEEERALIAALINVGSTGTAAIVASQLAGIDLFGASMWSGLLKGNGVLLLLLLASPVLSLDAAMLLPKWHDAADGDDAARLRTRALKADLRLGTTESGLRAMGTLYQMVAAGGQPQRSRLPARARLAVQLGLVALRDAARELLWRGLAVTFAALWLRDRCFEAGMDDVAFVASVPSALLPMLPSTGGGGEAGAAAVAAGGAVSVYTADAARWAAGAGATLAAVPGVLSEARAASATLVLLASYVASYEDDDDTVDPLIREFRMLEQQSIQEAAWLAPAAYTATAARGLLRVATLNAVFAASGSLACSLAVAVVTDAALLTYCETGRPKLPSVDALQQR